MEITGKIIKVLPLQGGTSKAGNEWKKCIFVIETQEQYPKKVAITLFGSDKIDQYNGLIQNNNDVKVSVDIESREYNERWYTDVNAWKIESAGANQNSVSNMGGQASNQFGGASMPQDDPFGGVTDFAETPKDDLPF